MVDAVVTLVFGGWLILSVLRQFRSPLSRAVAAADLPGWIPHWGVFALPARFDVSVLRRARHRDGTVTDWQDVVTPRERTRWNAAWHPHLSVLLVLNAFVNEVTHVSTARDREALIHRPRYRAVEGMVAGASAGADAVQFIVLVSRTHDSAVNRCVVFLSDFRPR